MGGLGMDQFMERAVELAIQNIEEGGTPFGAVIVKDGEIVAEGVNELHVKHDVSGHAELLAIRQLQEKLQTDDLSSYTMYASGQPCPMCLTALYYANITDVYYCASIEDAAAVGLGMSVTIYDDFKKANEARQIVMKHMPLKQNQADPMKNWQQAKMNKKK